MKKNLCILLLLTGMAHTLWGQSYIIDQVVATIGNRIIKQSEVEGQYLMSRNMVIDSNIDLKCFILEQMMIQKLLVTQAGVDSLTIDENSVEMELNLRLEEISNDMGGRDNMEAMYKMSYADIKDESRRRMSEQKLAEKMRDEVVKDVTITPTEVRQWYNKLNKDSIPIVPGKKSIAQICMYPPFEEETILAVRERLLGLRKRIIGGESFVSMALMYSEDGSASNGGEIGFASRSGLDPEYAKAAWALKPGEVSRIVESQFGFHIIQLIERKGDLCNTRHILMKPKPDSESIEKAISRLDTVAMLIRHDSIDFKTAAAVFSEEKNSRYNGGLMVNTNRRSDNYGSTWFEEKEIDPIDLKTLEGLKPGEMSAPYVSRDERGRLMLKFIKLNEETFPHPANPKDDYDMLQEAALNNKKQEVFYKWLEKKIPLHYIHVEESFRNCSFQFDGWLKQ